MHQVLFKILFNNKSNSTHSKLALDALKGLPDLWIDFFLYYNDDFIRGTRAPDKEFKDYKNHVLHVHDNFWGGAPKKLEEWYHKFVDALRGKRWKEAAYAAGVVTHYYSDPQQPLHTAQTEAEGLVHKFFEWGVLGSYSEIQKGFVNVTTDIPSGDNWLEGMLRDGALYSNKYYDLVVYDFDLKRGKRDPPSGLTPDIRVAVQSILSRVISGTTIILERGIKEADVSPPSVHLTLKTFLEMLNMPMYWITRKIEDAKIKKMIKDTYQEIEEKGKVVNALGEDDREVRAIHAKEVLKVSLKELDKRPIEKRTSTKASTKVSKKPKSKTSSPKEEVPRKSEEKTPKKIDRRTDKTASDKKGKKKEKQRTTRRLKFYLELTDPVDEAPEIGKKTAERLQKCGIATVKELIAAVPEDVEKCLNYSRIKADTIQRWQNVAKLQLQVPMLRGHDVQILVRVGILSPDLLVNIDSKELLEKVDSLMDTEEGKRIIRSGKRPDLEEIEDWKNYASHARNVEF